MVRKVMDMIGEVMDIIEVVADNLVHKVGTLSPGMSGRSIANEFCAQNSCSIFICPSVRASVTSLRGGRKRSHWRRRNHTTAPTVSDVSRHL